MPSRSGWSRNPGGAKSPGGGRMPTFWLVGWALFGVAACGAGVGEAGSNLLAGVLLWPVDFGAETGDGLG